MNLYGLKRPDTRGVSLPRAAAAWQVFRLMLAALRQSKGTQAIHRERRKGHK